MKHAVIVAHPNPASFNCAVAAAYAEAVRAFGHEAVVRDLYQIGFDPRLGARELPWADGYAPGADVAEERRLLHDAKVFVLVYPLWFNAPPAMMKGYIDRVFSAGFGYASAHGGSEPLLSGSSLISFTSSGAPDRWVEETGAVAALRKAFDDYLAQMCGLAVLAHQHFGGVVPGLSAGAVSEMLADVGHTAGRFFGPPSDT